MLTQTEQLIRHVVRTQTHESTIGVILRDQNCVNVFRNDFLAEAEKLPHYLLDLTRINVRGFTANNHRVVLFSITNLIQSSFRGFRFDHIYTDLNLEAPEFDHVPACMLVPSGSIVKF